MEERIGFNDNVAPKYNSSIRLNPYCNGRKNRMKRIGVYVNDMPGLNPYCSGRKNRMLKKIEQKFNVGS